MKKIIYFIIVLLLITVPLGLYFYISKNAAKNEVNNPQSVDPNTAPVKINEEKQKLLESLLKDRKPLMDVDQKAKAELIKQANPLVNTPNYVLVYNRKDDLFQVEMRTIKISTVREEVVAWFRSKGFSGAAICTLPVQFTLDKHNAESLKGSGIVFNPLPPGC